jgi:hypothetical protein
MDYDNPTPLRVGATGTLNGWSVRVAGRVVLSMDYEGETYTWSEFHLMDGSGNSATLVFEEGEAGPEWKLFREFRPAHPLTAREAASKKVGDMVNLDGSPVAITLVDQSRVVFIEGRAPLGVDVGDVADYFNADTGERMLVASWTGDEIEFYEGLDIPADGVADAFGFPRGSTPAPPRLSGAAVHPFDAQPSRRPAKLVSTIVFVVLGAVTLLSFRSCLAGSGVKGVSGRPPVKRAAPASAIANGAHGSLGRQNYVVTGQTVTEIARISGRHDRREYLLRGDNDENALLVHGLSGGAREWHLLRPAPVPAGLTPYDAAALRKGTPFAVADRALALTDLFLSRTLSAETLSGTDAIPPGAVEYGFVATAGTSPGIALARWNEQRIQVWAGQPLAEGDVLASFGRDAPKSR